MAILALTNPTYTPAMRIVSAITNANPAQITTTFAHGYRTGTIVRLYIPLGFGMEQADEETGTITIIDDTSFFMDIDTTTYDIFAAPADFPLDRQYAQVVPIGEINSTLLGSTQNQL